MQELIFLIKIIVGTIELTVRCLQCENTNIAIKWRYDQKNTILLRARLDCLTKPYDIMYLTKIMPLCFNFSAKLIK